MNVSIRLIMQPHSIRSARKECLDIALDLTEIIVIMAEKGQYSDAVKSFNTGIIL
jgi:hypothetical protein